MAIGSAAWNGQWYDNRGIYPFTDKRRDLHSSGFVTVRKMGTAIPPDPLQTIATYPDVDSEAGHATKLDINIFDDPVVSGWILPTCPHVKGVWEYDVRDFCTGAATDGDMGPYYVAF